ncbi:hypothetical protein LMG29542_03783 [Paraburkholderia humisilvae]|uniref:Uncharacterized protein n=1 Tax=Paraburkholderia humisilvae TaxID=627669 RepID=A0A6J5E531_9BURK|nr:hypothetical protein LMG29542_03783 [Paraburkholderia humisilvae]
MVNLIPRAALPALDVPTDCGTVGRIAELNEPSNSKHYAKGSASWANKRVTECAALQVSPVTATKIPRAGRVDDSDKRQMLQKA